MDKAEKGKEFIRPWAESGPHASTQRTHGLLESWPVPGGCWAGRALDGLHVQMACRLAVVARSERWAAAVLVPVTERDTGGGRGGVLTEAIRRAEQRSFERIGAETAETRAAGRAVLSWWWSIGSTTCTRMTHQLMKRSLKIQICEFY
jgi:hypothetical protein